MATTIRSIAVPNPPQDNVVRLSFEAFDLPHGNQRHLQAPHQPGTVTPLALRPSHDDTEVELDSAVETIRCLQAQGEILTNTLATHGCLLFRGLPINNADDFSKFAHAFGYHPHEMIGSVVGRPVLAPNVVLANESPPHITIHHHNESPTNPHAPGYVFFYCHRAPSNGGETPIASSFELFRRAQDEMPDFIEQLAEKGVLCKLIYRLEKLFPGGSTLKQAFGKHIVEGDDDEATKRAKIEAQIARYNRGRNTTWEWTDDTLVLTHRLPALRVHPSTGLPSLFTAMVSFYKNSLNQSSIQRKVAGQLFGDGTPIPDEYLARLAELTDEISVLHKWQEGDVLVYDNMICQHGRQPWKGEQSDRFVQASFFDALTVPKAYSEHDWAQLMPLLDDPALCEDE